MAVLAGQRPGTGKAARATGGVALARAWVFPGGQRIGHGAGDEAVDRLARDVHGEFRAGPGGGRGADSGGVLPDLIIGEGSRGGR
ncbi:hypothetical protein [Streptomyces sp. NPDC029041]|uniref:hypothetical protein n=1 Tax=Streptomyces sp. NPDC029041 TaxID=3155727 RepID=UPI0033D28057